MPRTSENQKEALFIPSVDIAAQMMRDAYRNADFARLKEIRDRLNNADVQKNMAGSADEFHNAAVELTRSNMFQYAYLLTQLGIDRYPYNTDLLSDALKYGARCKTEPDELERWYEALQNVKKRFWTWRAYQFSFDYLMDRLPSLNDEKQMEEVEADIFSIIQAFKDHFQYLSDQSDREKAYLMEYEYWISKGESEKAETALKTATDDVLPDKCPQCALKYADRMFEMGKYETVIPYAGQAVGIMEDQHSISYGYTYYILAMSREWVARDKNGLQDPQTRNQIFNDYYCAYLYMEAGRNNLMDVIKKRVRVLEFETKQDSGIDFDKLDEAKSNNAMEMLKRLLDARQGNID